MKPFTSDFLFSLTDKHQIVLGKPRPAVLDDETYYAFCKDYSAQCKLRDSSLKQHLLDNPNMYRTFLPWRPYIFSTVFQTQWYYDEIIMYDPVYFEINHFRSGNLEENKEKLLQLVEFLFTLKDSITEGFLLFGSYDTFANTNQIAEGNNFETLLSIPEVREECDRLVELYKMVSKEGKEKAYFQIRGLYRDRQVFFNVVQDYEKLRTEEGFEITYDLIGSEYLPVTVEEAKREGYYNRAYDGFKEDYPFEIKEILNYVDIGSTIKTPVLFDRKLDELILSNIASTNQSPKSRINDYYKLFLPFVDGIPSERLFELRTKIPTAFQDFRDLMFEMIYDFERSNIDTEMLGLKIRQKINPLIRKLEVEMKNSAAKMKQVGVGVPLIGGMGMLGLWAFGIDPSKLATLLLGGLSVAGEMANLTGYLNEQRVGKANPVYYLWRAQQR